jgi:hypothetical protein
MFPLNTEQIHQIFFKPDKDEKSSIVLNGFDISRFVSNFGTITRSMEYDTGKFSPARHSFKVENSKDFGDFLFTLRHQINAKDTVGTDYWTNLPYDLYYSYNSSYYTSSAVHLYKGLVNQKTEDRIKDNIKVSSNDVIKFLNDIKIAQKNKMADDIFKWTEISPNIYDHTFIQDELKYGVHKFIYNETTLRTLGCSCVWGGISPYSHSIITATNHGLKSYQEIRISGTTHFNDRFQIVVIDANIFWIRHGDPAWGVETGIITVYQMTNEKINLENPWNVTTGVKNKWECVKENQTQGTVYSIIHWYQEPGAPNRMYCRTSTNHDLAAGSYPLWTSGTLYYDDHQDYFHVGGTISAYTNLGGGQVRVTSAMKLPAAGGPWAIRIESSSLGYNGNYMATYVDLTHFDITSAYHGTEASSYVVSRDMRAFVFTPHGDSSGYLHVDTYDVNWLWYFPIQNYIKTTDVTAVWYWDYIAGMWCKFDPLNLTNVNYGFVIERDSLLQGIYVRKRNTKAIATDSLIHDTKWYFDNWSNYLAGNGSYFLSSEPKPLLAIEFNGYVYYPNSAGMNCYANPMAILWDLFYTHAGLDNGELDISNFAALDLTYTFDFAANYFLLAGNWATGGQINISINEETTLLDVTQELSLVSGVMITCSHIRSTDRRIRLVINRDYVHATDNPIPILTWATNNELNTLEISSDNDKTKNKILITNFIPDVSLPDNLQLITKFSGAADRSIEIALDEKPIVFWYNSEFWADRHAQNLLNKLEDAWEDVNLGLDARGIIIELGDYVKAYDHKVDEYIVLQVYTHSFNLDNNSTMFTGKKVWSSKD